MLNGSLVAPAYEASGAPPGGEVIPEPLWMGQANRTGGGSGCLLPASGGGKLQPYVTMGACCSSTPSEAERCQPFVTMVLAGLVPYGGKD